MASEIHKTLHITGVDIYFKQINYKLLFLYPKIVKFELIVIFHFWSSYVNIYFFDERGRGSSFGSTK